jgi:hypothetical protein
MGSRWSYPWIFHFLFFYSIYGGELQTTSVIQGAVAETTSVKYENPVCVFPVVMVYDVELV